MNPASYCRLHKFNSGQRKDCMLITEVKKYRFLYDKGEMNHKRSQPRQMAWNKIGKFLGMDGIDCMNRWKSLRDRYRKEKRLKIQDPNAASKKKKWIYYDLFSFLDPYLEDIKSITEELENIMNQPDDNSSAEDSLNQDFQLRTESLFDAYNSTDSLLDLPPEKNSLENNDQLQLIKIVLPSTQQQDTQSSSKPPARKYVKILPKSEKESPTSSVENGSNFQRKISPVTGIDNLRDDSSNDSLSFFQMSQKLDTVDHLMAFMGNTIKQLPLKRQISICQQLTSHFFNVISNENEDEEET